MLRQVLIRFILGAFLLICMVPTVVPADDQATEGEATISNDDASATFTGGPKIFLPENTFDFGNVIQSTTLIHVFKVVNQGDAVLKLIKVKGG